MFKMFKKSQILTSSSKLQLCFDNCKWQWICRQKNIHILQFPKAPFHKTFPSECGVLWVWLSQPHRQQFPSGYSRFYIHFMTQRQINSDWVFSPSLPFLLFLPLLLFIFSLMLRLKQTCRSAFLGFLCFLFCSCCCFFFQFWLQVSSVWLQ